VDNHGVGNTLHLVRRDGTDDQSLDHWEQFSWSPTNHQFTYVAFGGGLVIGEPLGKTTEVTSGGGTSHWVLADSPVWSPDGKTIAFIRDEREGVGLDTCCETNYGIWLVDVAGTTSAMNELYRHDVFEEGGSSPLQQALRILGWSGNGSSVYFVPLARGGPEGVEQLFSVSRNGGSPRSVGVQAFVSQSGFRSSLYFQDYMDLGPGGELALVTGEGYPAWTNKKVVKVDSTEHVVEVTDDGEVGLSPDWAQDGRLALVLQPDFGTLAEYSDYRGDWPITADLAPTGREQRRIWILSKDGKSLERLTEDSLPEERPQWSTDGRHIVFMAPRSGESLLGAASIRLYEFSSRSTTTLAEVDTFIDYGAGGEVSAVKMPIDFLGHNNWDAVFDWWQPSPKD
jgi:hypothetical protein